MKLENEALTFTEVGRWFSRADELVADGRIDLASVHRVDSAGVALLLELARRARNGGGVRLVLLDPPQQLRKLLTFFGLDGVFDIHAAKKE